MEMAINRKFVFGLEFFKSLEVVKIITIYVQYQCTMKKGKTGAQPAHRPVGPGLQIFGLITLPLVINYALLG